MSWKTAALAALSVFLATGGQLLLRSGMRKVGYIGTSEISRPARLIGQVATSPLVILGLALFVASALAWLIVLSRVSLSVAYPFAGLTYLLTTAFAKFVLHERVTGLRWIGLALIITGVLVVARSSPPEIAN